MSYIKTILDKELKRLEGCIKACTKAPTTHNLKQKKLYEMQVSKIKEAEEENRILRIDNASYKGAIAIERNKLKEAEEENIKLHKLSADLFKEKKEADEQNKECYDYLRTLETLVLNDISKQEFSESVNEFLNQQDYCNCPQGGLEKPISKTEYECTNCGKEIVNQKL